MDKLAHFDLSFQKKLDQLVDKDWHESFEDDTILPIRDALTKTGGEGSFWGGGFGFRPGNVSGTLQKGELRFFDNSASRGFNDLFWFERDDDSPSPISTRAINRIFLRIIFYISENWHNTLKLVDEKMSEVVALVYQKNDENLTKINLLEETVNKQQLEINQLETRLTQQEKLISQILTKDNENQSSEDEKDLIDFNTISDEESWYNLDE